MFLDKQPQGKTQKQLEPHGRQGRTQKCRHLALSGTGGGTEVQREGARVSSCESET